MSFSCRFLLAFCLGIITQKSFCPDEGYYVVLFQRYGRYHEVRVRIDMPNSSKNDAVDILQHYFSYSRGLTILLLKL